MMTRAPLSMSLNSRWLSLLVLLVGLAMATFAQATETDTQTKAKQLWQLLSMELWLRGATAAGVAAP